MDRFRIRALEKVIASEPLSAEDRLAAIRTLLQKIEIYAAGAKKRGKWDEVAEHEEKRKRYGEFC
jgi:hypothetical protein